MLNDQQMVEALEQAGLEVEQIIVSKPIDKRVVVALVNKVVQHPGADRLKIAEVETDEGKYGVVCGAPNVRAGLKVAFAQIGTVLPSGDKIEKVKLRGEVSEGMLCSEFELGLGNDHNGIMELSNDLTVGTLLCDIYPGDSIIDLKTPANRWDVQSVVGLAREVAAMTDGSLSPLSAPPVKFAKSEAVLGKTIIAKRYSLTHVKIDQTTPSPTEIVARLRAAGVRSIGPVVDVTNYVMLELGQPLHAFDAAKVKLPISVRHANEGEKLVTLDGTIRRLSPQDLVIADANGPVALAGLMGGKATEVGPETKEILLESAVFDSVMVRRMAMRHGLRTEASARMERGLPTALPPLGLARALELLGQVAGGKLVAAYEAPFEAPKPWKIALPLARLQQFLGFGISYNEAKSALERLEIPVKPDSTVENSKKSEVLVVPEVPWWRHDLHEPEDLIEEVVRVISYGRVPSTIPSWRPRRIAFDRRRATIRAIRDVAWASGAFEVMTYSFVSAEQLAGLGMALDSHLKLKNPLSVEQAYMRSSMLPSHLATLERNRMYAKDVKFYEISKVFISRGLKDQPDEPVMLAATVLDPEAGYATAKGLLDAVAASVNVDLQIEAAEREGFAPGRYGEIWLDHKKIGGIGQLHPVILADKKIDGEAAYLEVDLQALVAAAAVRVYIPTSPFPAITHDITLHVPDSVTWQAVRKETRSWDVRFVGDYYGRELPAGFKSLTVRLRLTLPDRTPTEADAAELEATVVNRLVRKLGAKRPG